MKIIGLTGPSGAGKSTVCERFEELNIPYINTDEVYHCLINSPSPCLDELKDFFGEQIINDNGSLNRKRLASLVFEGENSKENLKTLNSITHKYVWERTNDIINECKNKNKKAVVIDAPALFSSEVFVNACDFIISVLCEKELRAQRIVLRDNISFKEAMARINSQPDDNFFIENSNYCIYNTGAKSNMTNQLNSILEKEEIFTYES